MHKEQILSFAQATPGSYDLDELERLYAYVHTLPQDSIICEIGVQYGRTASLYLNENRHKVYLVDCWIENEGDSKPYFFANCDKYSWWDRFEPLWYRSDIAASYVPNNIALLHIDGGHTPEAIEQDCKYYLPKVKVGGIVVFHDYKRKGRDPLAGTEFPGVEAAIDSFTGNSNWEDLGTVNTQVARRKLLV